MVKENKKKSEKQHCNKKLNDRKIIPVPAKRDFQELHTLDLEALERFRLRRPDFSRLPVEVAPLLDTRLVEPPTMTSDLAVTGRTSVRLERGWRTPQSM